jgi:hypothetical protein
MYSRLADQEQAYDGPIPSLDLAIARFGYPEMVAHIRARGELAFFRSMIRGQIKTIRMRRVDDTYYPALITDLQLYRQQFRKWNRFAIDARRKVEKRDLSSASFTQTLPCPTQLGPGGRRIWKGEPMNPMLRHHLAQHEYLRRQLTVDFPDADEDTIRDTLEGLSTLPEMLACALRSYLDDVALIAALGIRITDMQERITRFEQRAEKKRSVITSVMEQADLKKLSEPDFTVSFRITPPSLVVTAESEIPAAYWKPQPAKLDRQGLTSALRRGESVPGAVLGNGQSTISVRTR